MNFYNHYLYVSELYFGIYFSNVYCVQSLIKFIAGFLETLE